MAPLSESLFLQIFERIHAGEGVAKVLRELKINSMRFFNALDADPKLALAYSRAQQSRAELLADEVIDISDTEPDPMRARMRIDARRWYASKIRSDKYGDRVDLHIQGNVSIGDALLEAKSRAAALTRHSEQIEDAILVEPKQLSAPETTDKESVSSEDATLEERNADLFG